MTRNLVQLCCVLIIALGSGLLGFSNKFEPQISLADPTTLTHLSMVNVNSDEHYIASITSGLGTGFLVLGLLGLVIPWISQLGAAVTGELSDNSARTMATIAIWFSVAVILTFGVFSMHWTGAAALGAVLVVVAVICLAATVASAMVCGWRPWNRPGHEVPSSEWRSSPSAAEPLETTHIMPTAVPPATQH